MGPIESGFILRLDDLRHHAGNVVELVGRGVVGDPQHEHDTTLVHTLEVVNARLDEVAVRNCDLLARQRADARGLDTDLLHRAALIAEHDEIADLEGPIEDDGERGKQIAKHALGGERHGDTANAKTGDQRGYVEARDSRRSAAAQSTRPRRAPRTESAPAHCAWRTGPRPVRAARQEAPRQCDRPIAQSG